MRILSRPPLIACGLKHPDSKKSLDAWYNITKKAKWQNPNEVKQTLPDASILKDNRVVFNIKGGSYRLIVFIEYNLSIVYICWVGTHTDYDKIDADIVWNF